MGRTDAPGGMACIYVSHSKTQKVMAVNGLTGHDLFWLFLYLLDSFTSRASAFLRAPNNRFDSRAGLSN